ncbi:mitogen-activated protein kinase 15 isoform X2 [Antennarius striatus]
MDTDLHAVIKKGTLLKDVHKRYVMYQLLKAIKYLHSGNVIHRDQKPSNVLLDSDCVVKLCDFGLSRSLNKIQEDSGNPALTEYVATRWYRAPEILLGSTRYTKGVDMWSLGCILGEMLLGKALFPGTSTINQVEKIMSSIPHPSAEDILAIKSEYGSSVIQRMLLKQQVPLEDLLHSSVPADALDLLKGLLVFNPDKRLTAEQALEHPYVARFHSPAKEPALNYDVVLPVDDDVQLSAVQYRNKLYEMMQERRNHQGMLRLIQSKDRSCADSGEKHHVGANGSKDDDHEVKAQHEGTDETNYVPSKASTTKPGTVNMPSAVVKMDPVAGVGCGKLTYNPITHAPNGFLQSTTRPHYYHSTAASTRQVEQTSNTNAASPSRECNNTDVSMDQILQRGRSAPATHSRSFSSAINQTQNNLLVRKDELSLTSGLQVTVAHLNQRSNSQTRPHFSKKVFQSNCNVAAAGDPRAKLGSYTQAYGTINKSELDSLLRSQPSN